jgi:DNA polymerase-4
MPIFHLDIEAFMAEVERVKNRSLARRPLVIAPRRARASVIAASGDAKKLGIRRDMPLDYVHKHFPGIHVIPPNIDLYDRANRFVLQVASTYSPIVEPVRYGHVAMDMTGMRQLFGNLENAALKLNREIRERARLPATVGIAVNKLVSTIAAKEIQKESDPFHSVQPGDEARFLSPLPCKALPDCEDPRVNHLLFELNLKHIRQIQAIPRDIFSFAIGEVGLSLHKHASGQDPRPVVPAGQGGSVGAEHRFHPDTNDDDTLRATLYTLLERLCFQLRAGGQVARKANVGIKYSDDVWRNRRFTFPQTQKEEAIHQTINEHFEKLCDRRRRVRLLRLSLGGLFTYSQQLQLFEDAKPDRVAPHLDTIRKRFGDHRIQLGKGLKSIGAGTLIKGAA